MSGGRQRDIAGWVRVPVWEVQTAALAELMGLYRGTDLAGLYKGTESAKVGGTEAMGGKHWEQQDKSAALGGAASVVRSGVARGAGTAVGVVAGSLTESTHWLKPGNDG